MAIETVQLGGAEMVMLNLAEELRRRGHHIIPIGPEGRTGWLRSRFVDLGFGWYEYVLGRPLSWARVRQFTTLLRDCRADIAHSHEFAATVYGAAASVRAGIPHIASMHGNQTMTAKLQRRVALRWALRASATGVAVSQDTRAHLEQTLGLRSGSVAVIPNGVPSRSGSRAVVRRNFQLDEQDVLVVAVGSLMQRKGHRVLIDAMQQLAQRGTSSRVLVAIAGEGAEREALTRCIDKYSLSDRVLLLGNRSDVPDLLSAADIFVMPSLWEGLPLAVLEAMHASLPIIATTASGIPEAVRDGVEGLLVEPGSAVDLADSMRRLIEDPEERRAMGVRARTRAVASFSVEAMTDAYERLYREALG